MRVKMKNEVTVFKVREAAKLSNSKQTKYRLIAIYIFLRNFKFFRVLQLFN